MWELYLLYIFLMIAWLRIEVLRGDKSTGIASMILGCLIFAYGTAGVQETEKFFWILIVATGLFIALFGLGRFVVNQLESN